MIKYLKKMYKKSKVEFYKLVEDNLVNNKKMFIITANPETLMIGSRNEEFDKLLLSKDVTIIADGIGVIKAGRMLDIKFVEKIPGVEVALKLLEYGNKYKKTIYCLGATETVVQLMRAKLKKDYPHLKIVGFKNGYDENKVDIFNDIVKKSPDIVLVGLGIPKQELLISKFYDQFSKGIFVGVGGTFDVLSGYKKRAPKLFQNLNLEWLYRIVTEPSRLKRFYNNNIKFLFEINKIKKDRK